MAGGLAVRDHEDLTGASLVLGQELSGQHECVVHVGAGLPVVPGDLREHLLADLHGVVGESHYVEPVTRKLRADQG